MADENFDDWDPDFLDQLVQAEELALSSTNPTAPYHPPPPPPHYGDVSYSPPRELSQRPKDHAKGFDNSNGTVASVPYICVSHDVKNQEIDALKKELGRASEQLINLKQELLEFRKERDKKEVQLKSVFSRIEAEDAEVHCTKIQNLEYGVDIPDHHGISLGCQYEKSSNHLVGSRINVGTSACKAVGVQTDEAGESTHLTFKNDLSTPQHCPSKLLGVWDSQNGQKSGKNLVNKLFIVCETDFLVLFGCLNSSLSHKTTTNSSEDESCFDVALQNRMQVAHSAESAKVSHLYSMLTKISNGMVKLEAVLEALVDLCGHENVVIVYRSLRVLNAVLNYLFNMERKFDNRDNVMVEGLSYWNNVEGIYGSECSEIGSPSCAIAYETSDPVHTPFGMKFFNLENFCKKEARVHDSTVSISSVDWVSLFGVMCQISTRNNKEHVRLEAVSIMNMILMRTNAYLERKKFGDVVVFQCVSLLLSKEAGFCVQKQAVHLLYLLLNCPKLMASFCSGCKEGESDGAASSDARNDSSFQEFCVILEGLADILTCGVIGAQELKLRRHVVILLAFLASSGKSGLEILLGHRLRKRTVFLALILQSLISEMDVEASESAEPPEIFKERTLFIRETLILLNRIVSNPPYATPALRVLTNSRDVACSTIDIANRLSRKGKWPWQSDSITRQIRESEIVDLARVFKKRVFTFLGDAVS